MSKLDDSTPDVPTPIMEPALDPKLYYDNKKSLFSATLDFQPSDEILQTAKARYTKPKSAKIA